MKHEEMTEVLDEAQTELMPVTMRDRIITDLEPIADRMGSYAELADTITVTDKVSADSAAVVCANIAQDVKTVKNHEILSKCITGVHTLHRMLTGLRNDFVNPMESDRKTIKRKVIDWQEGERRKAEVERARLQAVADEKARKEQERLQKEAAKLKTPEKREQRMEQAAQVVAPVIQVQAEKAMKVSKVWAAEVVDPAAFFAAIAQRPELAGYVEISTTKLARAKSANPLVEIPGVEFRKVTR